MLQRSSERYNQCLYQCTAQQGGINTLPEGKFNNIKPRGHRILYQSKVQNRNLTLAIEILNLNLI